MNSRREYVTVKEAAARTNKSEVYIRRIMSNNQVWWMEENGRKYVDMISLVEYLNSRRGAQKHEQPASQPEPEPTPAVEMPQTLRQAAKLLGLRDTIFMDRETVRKAYRSAAMKNHPDRGGNEDLMKATNIAYEILNRKAF